MCGPTQHTPPMVPDKQPLPCNPEGHTNTISSALTVFINAFIENVYFLGDLRSQGQGGTVPVLGSHSSFHEARKKIIYLRVALMRSEEGFREGLGPS